MNIDAQLDEILEVASELRKTGKAHYQLGNERMGAYCLNDAAKLERSVKSIRDAVSADINDRYQQIVAQQGSILSSLINAGDSE